MPSKKYNVRENYKNFQITKSLYLNELKCTLIEAIHIPTNAKEILVHPVVEMIFDNNLPQVEGWHASAIFLLQTMIKHLGLEHDPLILELEKDINEAWDSGCNLRYCTTDEIRIGVFSCIKFCKENGEQFNKYMKKFIEMLN